MSTQTETKVPAASATPDYPSYLPPMLVKELRQLLRTRGFIAVLLGIHVLMIFVLLLLVIMEQLDSNSGYGITNGLFWSLMSLVLLIITPLRGGNSLNQEFQTKSIDLLLLTRLSANRIVLGKWGSLMATGSLFALSLLPYGMLRYFFGPGDMLGDACQLLAMATLSATLTAISVWGSSLARVSRILVPIIVVVTLQIVASRNLGRVASGAFAGTTGPFGFSFAETLMLSACMVFVLLFALLQASRKLRPLAENDAPVARALPLIAFGAGLLLWAFAKDHGVYRFAFVFSLFVCAIELSQARKLLAVHWKPWAGRNVFQGLAGWCALPGFPSAAFFAAVLLGLFALAGLWPALRILGSSSSFAANAWLMALAWQGLVFPGALMGCLTVPQRNWNMGGMQFVIHGLMGILSLFAWNAPVMFVSLKSSLLVLGGILPISSFWLGLPNLRQSGVTTQLFLGQVIMMAGVAAMLWYRAGPAFAELRKNVLRSRQAGAVPPIVRQTR